MQGEMFAKPLPMGRDFALKIRDIPEQPERMAWLISFKDRAKRIPTIDSASKFREACFGSGTSAFWEVWRNATDVAGMQHLQRAMAENRMPVIR